MSKTYGKGGIANGSVVYGSGGVPSGTKVYGRGAEFSGSPVYSGDFWPSEIAGLKLWCKQGVGITVTGSGVSQWDDVSGNGNHLKQGTDTNRPSKEADGSILFDGVDNFLKADAFTLVQPETIYILGKQITWTSGDRFFDGDAANTGTLDQIGTTPQLTIYAGTFLTSSISLTLDTYGAISSVFNTTSSVIQLNNDTPGTTGTVGAGNMGGFTLAANGGAAQFGHVQIKECLVYNTAHDAATRTQIINYLLSL